MGIMERLLKVFVLLLFILTLLYSSFWFYRADTTKRTLMAELEAIQEFDIGNFRFGEIKVTGFPFSYTIEIADLQLYINQDFAVTKEKVPVTRLSLPRLIVQSDFSGSKYSLEPVGDIHLQNPQGKYATIKPISPVIHLFLPQNTWKDGFNGEIYLSDLCSFSYEDTGFDIISGDSGNSIFSGEGTKIISDCKKERRNLRMDFALASKINRGKGYKDFTGHDLATEHFKLDVNISALSSRIKGIAKHYVELTVQSASLSLDNATLTLEGTFKGPTLMFYSPDAETNLALGINNYPELLDTGIQNKWITENNKTALIQLLPDISNTMDDERLLVNIQRTSNKGSVYVGKMPFSDAFAKFHNFQNQNYINQNNSTENP